jgi:serine protease Do
MKRLFSTVFCLLLAAPALAQFGDTSSKFLRSNPKFLGAFKEVVEKPSASTVRILCQGKDTALGMIVGSDGWILTKANDLKGRITVRLRDGTLYEAKLVGVHNAHDLAMLKIEASGLTPVEFGDTKNVEVGAWLAGVGMGEEPVSIGVVSVATRELKGIFGAGKDPSKMPYLGVSLDVGEGGVKVAQVMPNTPAAKVGIKANDVIIRFGKDPITDPDDFMKHMAKYKPGDTVTFKIKRGETEIDQSVKLEPRPTIPDGRGDFQNKMGSELSSRRSGYPTILQHDAVVRPSDCGGPIVDLDGKVIGINICRAGRTESWVVPGEVIRPLLFDLISGKYAVKEEAGTLTLDEQIDSTRQALRKAELDKAQSEKRLGELRVELEKLETQARLAKEKERTDAAERMLVLIKQRLDLMNDVAAFKWKHRQDVADSQRESDLLKLLVKKGQEAGIPSAMVTAFFKQQFEASRKFQEDRISQWQKDNTMPEVKVKDLQKELRPKIEKISEEMVQVLGKLHSCIFEPAVQNHIEARAKVVIAGAGISEAVRDKATEWLRKR